MLPIIEKFPLPPIDVTVSTVSFADSVMEPVLAGGMTPEPPVDVIAKELPLVAKVAPPDVAETVTITESFAEELGAMISEVSLLLAVAFELDVDHACDPTSDITVGGGLEFASDVEFEPVPVPIVVVMTSERIVEMTVTVLLADVKLLLPEVTVEIVEFDGYTKSDPVDDGP